MKESVARVEFQCARKKGNRLSLTWSWGNTNPCPQQPYFCIRLTPLGLGSMQFLPEAKKSPIHIAV